MGDELDLTKKDGQLALLTDLQDKLARSIELMEKGIITDPSITLVILRRRIIELKESIGLLDKHDLLDKNAIAAYIVLKEGIQRLLDKVPKPAPAPMPTVDGIPQKPITPAPKPKTSPDSDPPQAAASSSTSTPAQTSDYKVFVDDQVTADKKIHPFIVTNPKDLERLGLENTTPLQQAQAVVAELKKISDQYPDIHIGITYSANEEQSLACLVNNGMPAARDIGGSGQAKVFNALIEELNKKGNEELKSKIHILPLSTTATAVKKDAPIVPPNEITTMKEMVNIARSLRGYNEHNYIVLGIKNKKSSNRYSIGGNTVPLWPDSPLGQTVDILLVKMTTGELHDLSDENIEQLFKATLKEKQAKVTSNKDTKTTILADLVTSSPVIEPEIMEAIATHPNVDADTLMNLIERARTTPSVLAAIARNPKANKKILGTLLANTSDINVLIAIAGNKETNDHIRQEIIDKGIKGLDTVTILTAIQAVANNEKPEQIRDHYLKSKDLAIQGNAYLRKAASLNPKIAEIVGLLKAEDEELAISLAKTTNQPSFSVAIIEAELFKNKSAVVAAVYENTSIAKSRIITPTQAKTLAAHDKVTPEFLLALLGNVVLKDDKEISICIACHHQAIELAQSPDITPEQAIRLVRHTDNYEVLLKLKANAKFKHQDEVIQDIQDGNKKLTSGNITSKQAIELATHTRESSVLLALLNNTIIKFSHDEKKAFYTALAKNNKIVDAIKKGKRENKITEEQVAELGKHNSMKIKEMKSAFDSTAVEKQPTPEELSEHKPKGQSVDQTATDRPRKELRVTVGGASKTNKDDVVDHDVVYQEKLVNKIWDKYIEHAKENPTKYSIAKNGNAITYEENKPDQVVAQKEPDKIIIRSNNPPTKASVAQVIQLAEIAAAAIPEDQKAVVTINAGSLNDVLEICKKLSQQSTIEIQFTDTYKQRVQATASISGQEQDTAKELLKILGMVTGSRLPMSKEEPELPGGGNPPVTPMQAVEARRHKDVTSPNHDHNPKPPPPTDKPKP